MKSKILAILGVGVMSLFLSAQAHAWGNAKDKDKGYNKNDTTMSDQSTSGMTDKDTLQQNRTMDSDTGDYDSTQFDNKALNDDSTMNQQGSSSQKFDHSQSKSSQNY